MQSRFASWLGVIASCISIVVFLTGIPGLPQLLGSRSTPPPEVRPEVLQLTVGPALTILLFVLTLLGLFGIAFLLALSLSRILPTDTAGTWFRGLAAVAALAVFLYVHQVLYRVFWVAHPFSPHADTTALAGLFGHLSVASFFTAGAIELAGLFPLITTVLTIVDEMGKQQRS